jgi:hypothetical protein
MLMNGCPENTSSGYIHWTSGGPVSVCFKPISKSALWWKPPHLCGGRSASALRETVSTRSCALALAMLGLCCTGFTGCGKLALYPN